MSEKKQISTAIQEIMTADRHLNRAVDSIESITEMGVWGASDKIIDAQTKLNDALIALRRAK